MVRRSAECHGHKVCLESVKTLDCSQLASLQKLRGADCFVVTFNWTDEGQAKSLEAWVAACRALSPYAVFVFLGNCLDKLNPSVGDKRLKQLEKLMKSLRIPTGNKASLPVPRSRSQEMVSTMVKNIILEIRKHEQQDRLIFNPTNDPSWDFVLL